MNKNYEDWAYDNTTPLPTPPRVGVLTEAFRGVSVVGWHGNIERQLIGMVDRFTRDKNLDDAIKVREFLKTWRDHKITGAINREDVEVLQAAAAQLAVDPWKARNYFSNLRTSLDQIIAGEEELPRGMTVPPKQAPRTRASVTPPKTEFGGEKEAPSGQGQPGGGAAAGVAKPSDNSPA